MVFYRRGVRCVDGGREVVLDYEKRIDQAVFPGLHGAPHQHTITALAVALKEASDQYKHGLTIPKTHTHYPKYS